MTFLVLTMHPVWTSNVQKAWTRLGKQSTGVGVLPILVSLLTPSTDRFVALVLGTVYPIILWYYVRLIPRA